MNIRQPKVYVIVEIDQSDYLDDEDWPGLESGELLDRHSLARILDKDAYHPTRQWLRLEKPEGLE